LECWRVGAFFLENNQTDSEKNFKKLYKNFGLQSIADYEAYLFGDNNLNIENNVLAELSDKMTIPSEESIYV
jgi:hypothetical protein